LCVFSCAVTDGVTNSTTKATNYSNEAFLVLDINVGVKRLLAFLTLTYPVRGSGGGGGGGGFGLSISSPGR
jgi:hypothetical protein